MSSARARFLPTRASVVTENCATNLSPKTHDKSADFPAIFGENALERDSGEYAIFIMLRKSFVLYGLQKTRPKRI